MVEELKDASDIKKLIGKNKGEEDPLLVAQRFLNIFRQLHIFDQKRRDEFNSMILSQTPEIRGSFGLLPGGSVLQEYVDELEISKGIAKSNGSNIVSPSILEQTQKESPLAKIKNAQQQASSSAQVNISGDAKLVADASFAQVLSQSVSNALMAANASKEDNFDKLAEAIKENSGNGKIVPDEKFAAAMARAFSQALQYSDAGKKADIKELIAAVRESRKIELPEGVSFGGGNNTPKQLISDESAFAKTIAMTVAKVIQDSNNNANLSSEIKDLASAVRESRKIEFPEGFSWGNTSTINSSAPLISDEAAFAKTIAEAMAKVINVGTNVATSSPDIKELINAIRENNNSNAEAISKAMISGLGPLLNSLEKNKNTIATPTRISLNADNDFSEIIAKAFAQTFEISEKKHQEQTERLIAGFQEALSKDKNNTFETKNNKGKQFNQQQTVSIANEQLEKITQDFTKTLQSINDSRKSENREISQAIKETSKELAQMFAKHNKGYIAPTQDKEMINEIISQVAQVQSNIFQEMSKQQTTELSSIISLALKESQKTSVDTIVSAVSKLQSSRSIFNFANHQTFEDMSKASSNIETWEDGGITETTKDIKITTKDKKSSVDKYIKSAFERSSSTDDNSPVSGADWGFSTEDDNTTAIAYDENTAISSNDKEWEYETNESGEPQGLEGEDWEWEYEEDGEVTGTEGEDWEWEYEDSDADTAFTSSEESWEYEENEVTESQGLEGEDWEWEYEEDNDNTFENTQKVNQDDINIATPMLTEVSSEDSQATTKNTISVNEPPFADKGEIVIAELRNKQNFADPYLMDNVGV